MKEKASAGVRKRLPTRGHGSAFCTNDRCTSKQAGARAL